MGDTPFDATCMIETGGDGRLADPTTAAQVAKLAADAVAHGHLVIHLHGGLVNSGHGRATAAALVPLYRAKGGFPVAMVWHTGPGEVVCGNLREIAKEDVFQRLLKLVLRYVVGRLTSAGGAKSGAGFDPPSDLEVKAELDAAPVHEPFGRVAGRPARLTADEVQEFEAAVRKDPDLNDAVDHLVKGDAAAKGVGGFAGPVVMTRMDPRVLADLGGGDAEPGGRGIVAALALVRHTAAVLVRVIGRFSAGRDHGVLATCVEEIAREFYLASAGGAFWGAIKKDADDAFEAVAGQERGGRLLVDALARKVDAGGLPPRITVVGHSAGAIYACRLLRELALRELRVTDLVLVAAAVRYSLAGDTLEALGPLRPKRLHFVGLTEACESGYWEVPGFYPRSLLYMVSGAAERDPAGESLADEPLVGMARFFDTGVAAADTAPVRAAMRHAFTLAWVGPRVDGSMQKHGGLTDPAQAPEVIAILQSIVGSPA